MKNRSPSRARWGLCLIASAIVLLCAGDLGCQRGNPSRIRIELKDLPQDKPALATKPAQPAPLCPPAGLAPLQLGAPGTGDHKVTLTWNASAASTDSDRAAFGYCLYRSKIKHVAKKDPVCKECEQINRIPIKSTGCIDDVVADSTRYYYVVTAVNSKGTLSAASNEIATRIPSKHRRNPAQPSPLPLCRAGLQPPTH
jgi:hypothetical protein